MDSNRFSCRNVSLETFKVKIHKYKKITIGKGMFEFYPPIPDFLDQSDFIVSMLGRFKKILYNASFFKYMKESKTIKNLF